MHHQKVAPPEELRDTIHSFWYTRIDFEEVPPPGFEIVPDGYAEIIFHFGTPCYIIHQGSRQLLPSPFLMGLLGQPVLLQAEDRLEVIGIKCYPWTVFDLLGLPSGKGVRMFEHPVAGLKSALAGYIEGGKIEEALDLVRYYFLNAKMDISGDCMLFKAGQAMRKAAGTLPVSQVAAAAHATVRTLERKFKQSSGHTVKDVSALMRFEQVRNHLWVSPDVNLAQLAQAVGYADQAHLSREFKRYSGNTPAAFARKTKQSKQVISDDFVAFVQA